jgi:hypothetical protein
MVVKAGCIGGEICDTAVSRYSIRKRDNGAGMQIAIRRHDRLHHRQLAADPRFAHLGDDDAEMTRQFTRADTVEFLRRTQSAEIAAHVFARLCSRPEATKIRPSAMNTNKSPTALIMVR